MIISENELLHTDNFSDVIEHHGVKGMKWGQRMKRWGSAYGGMVKRRLRHPMLYDVARRKTRGMTGSPLSATSRHMEYTNRVIDDMAKANKQYKKDIIEHYGIKGMRWGIRSRHADLRANHESYKKMKREIKSMRKDLINQYGTKNDPGFTKWRTKHKIQYAKKYNKAEEIRRSAQELYEKNGRKVTPRIQKRLDKYNMLQREVKAHDALYNTHPLDYVLRKGEYDKFNVHRETKTAMRKQRKMK